MRFGLRTPMIRYAVLAAVALACCPGCNSEKLPRLGRVTGTIRMDSSPVSDATVSFEPIEPGRTASLGRTDANGNYELYYSRGHKGATIGPHLVKITTYGGGAETVPSKYNVASELKADIKRGKNSIDFDLQSDGDIYQPGEFASKGKKRAPPPTGCG